MVAEITVNNTEEFQELVDYMRTVNLLKKQ